jgi:hypothetical protein
MINLSNFAANQAGTRGSAYTVASQKPNKHITT